MQIIIKDYLKIIRYHFMILYVFIFHIFILYTYILKIYFLQQA